MFGKAKIYLRHINGTWLKDVEKESSIPQSFLNNHEEVERELTPYGETIIWYKSKED